MLGVPDGPKKIFFGHPFSPEWRAENVQIIETEEAPRLGRFAESSHEIPIRMLQPAIEKSEREHHLRKSPFPPRGLALKRLRARNNGRRPAEISTPIPSAFVCAAKKHTITASLRTPHAAVRARGGTRKTRPKPMDTEQNECVVL